VKQLAWLFFKYVLFWLLFFFLQRSLFIYMGMGGFQDLTWTDLWTTQQHAFPLDLSMTGYILALPAVSFVILLFLQSEKDLNRKWIRIFFLIAVFLCTLIFMADLSLYPEWSSKINRKAMASLAYPDKVLISALSAPLVWMGSLLSICLLVNYVLFCFFFRAEIRIKATLPKKVIASSVLILVNSYRYAWRISAHAFEEIIGLFLSEQCIESGRTEQHV